MPDPVTPAKQGAPAGATGGPAVPSVEPEGVNIVLDGRAVRAREGEMLIAAAERAGTYIPRFCYHPRMKPVGMCRMCLVEIKGPRGSTLSPACYISATEGMEVVTDSPKVKKAQDGVLEFLLVNHPLDCPVCDKGGECPLQDQTLAYGPAETRYVEEKRHWDKPVPLSSLVLIDRERCIQCARCTRFADEVAGDAGIDFASRSDSTEVAIYPSQPFTSNFSGNVVQICPVGALLATPYRFRARPWDLEQVETTCTFCAVGCRVAAQSSSEQVVRFIGVDSDPVNWGWLCDKGRFGFEALNSPERLSHPLLRAEAGAPDEPVVNGSEAGRDFKRDFKKTSWAAAIAEVVSRTRDVPGERIGVIGGARLANEDAYAWAKLARAVLHTDNVDAQLGDGLPPDVIASLPRATIDEICGSSLIVTIAPDIKEELPVLYLRLRDAIVQKGVPLIEISPAPTGLSSRAAQSLRYRPGELAALVGALCSPSEATAPIAGVPATSVEQARQAMAVAAAASTGGKGPDADGHSRHPAVGVVLGRPSLAEGAGAAAESALLLAARLPGVGFLPALRRSNVSGAIDLGLAPGLLPGRVSLDEGRQWYESHWGATLPEKAGLDTPGILAKAAAGQVDVLFLLGADPLGDCPDWDLAYRGLTGARFVVAIDGFATASVAHADVILPAAIYTERRGSFTNIEGRVTWLGQKVTPPGTARPDWMIAVDLASRLGVPLGPRSLEEFWAEIETVSPLHAGVSSSLLKSRQGRNGVVVPLQAGGATEAEVPPPLDPMADPGIASAEIHPAPPVPPSFADAGGQRPGGTSIEPPSRLRPGTAPATARPAPGYGGYGDAATATVGGGGEGKGLVLRLVTSRPMWDGGAHVQKSPSLAGLYPPQVLSLHPADLARLLASAPEGSGRIPPVRVSSARGSVVVPVSPDQRLALGSALLPFNLPNVSAGMLIDANSEYTEVTVELVGGQG
ncbi:MAG TPA: NADH-quinone oxidoreductase subunit NuoG [Acidimicrobiales bacterium]|nr:NADH-quinone oxidoreductase subunit NuoG [Acidimicrobiales bacterium]